MKKVIITPQQAKAIELIETNELLTHEETVYAHAHTHQHNPWRGEYAPLNSMNMLTLVDALRIGYEIRPNFEIGDLVKFAKSTTGKVYKVTGNRGGLIFLEHNLNAPERNLQHLTDKEKVEYEWWDSRGREVWELKKGDILEFFGDLLIVDDFIFDQVILLMRYESSENSYAQELDYVKENYMPVCFAEDRQDLSYAKLSQN